MINISIRCDNLTTCRGSNVANVSTGIGIGFDEESDTYGDLLSFLRKGGWVIIGNNTYCPDCGGLIEAVEGNETAPTATPNNLEEMQSWVQAYPGRMASREAMITWADSAVKGSSMIEVQTSGKCVTWTYGQCWWSSEYEEDSMGADEVICEGDDSVFLPLIFPSALAGLV